MYRGVEIRGTCEKYPLEYADTYVFRAKINGTHHETFENSMVPDCPQSALSGMKEWIDKQLDPPPVPEWKKILGELGFKEEVYR